MGGGGITTLGAFHTFRKPCVAGYQNGKLCRFWALVGGALEEYRKPSEQRCAYACRCPEGVAAPLGCVICLQLGDVAVFSLCAQYFLNVRGGGGITTLGAFHTFRKPCVAGYQNGKLCRFWVLAGCTPEGRRKPSGQRCAYACRCPAGVAAPLGCVILVRMLIALLGGSVANFPALWYDKFNKLESVMH